MYELTLFHLGQAERDREAAADDRRRRLLKDAQATQVTPHSAATRTRPARRSTAAMPAVER